MPPLKVLDPAQNGLLCCLLEEMPDGSSADGYLADEFLSDQFDSSGMPLVTEYVFCLVEQAAGETFELSFVAGSG